MPINEICNLGVICCEANTSIPELASLMRRHHVGDVVVVEKKEGQRIPIGIVTDRDIVIETIAPEVDMNLLTAGDIMSTPLVTAREDESLTDVLRTMRAQKVRRVPIVTATGTLYGIVTADDIVDLLSMELSMMTKTMADQPVRESHLRR
ncbi:MAG TPA: CBS domain-containing protein [Burkholderiaceae bacterium]|nr:CBS domain-containing protein [Burkholderiaceae bacterium]